MIAKKLARNFVFPFITGLGLEKIFSVINKNKCLILAYHGVTEKPNFAISNGHIDTAQFEKHLKYFKKNFNVVPSSEIFEMYRKNIIPKKPTIAITFDDGYENNFTQAFPLLKKYNLPATFFIATQCIEDNKAILWYDKLYFIKHKINFLDIDFSDIQMEEQKRNELLKCKTNGDFVNFIKNLYTDEKELFFKKIKTKVNYEEIVHNSSPEMWKTMSKEQLIEMSKSPLVELGSHTHTHPNLGEIKLEQVIWELKKSKQLLEEVTGKEIISMAFPDSNYSEEVKGACRDLGYKNLFAVDYQLNSDKEDKSILPRFCISCTTTAESNIIQINAAFGKSGF